MGLIIYFIEDISLSRNMNRGFALSRCIDATFSRSIIAKYVRAYVDEKICNCYSSRLS